ncbi:MAG: 50S ribosomal protein L17 [Candidatus Kerfeldbacteria bacterium CG15_BIG_FIL_POST_REV_8_21_14_020_45_12]|uniref:50S ribosomal protein L17 n=1 Tax=Candidatus Kerfeldbacteria bacterium CG15_BIG_FIL_POST_REV_8_21_14_020_45_12 TaxID=2014247 RepID=A0A2M7H403_9BACT|nr:MAG: 50S ribosomal protein L17 [Candidatus Kerfeldbacteria bacterium CG15_BIG_FIL_POST_REV_8_21_14_020_45_12]PJA93051.1 MAG: 50S ribosomal protein L17 [Candidatus Kerfeldbacteria bacterium CG_4_9_14_3_um_filter_45_8]
MRHKKKKLTIGRLVGPRKALVRTLAMSLIENGSVTTTPTKARALQQFVEPLITTGKAGGMNAIRLVEKKLGNKLAAMQVVNRLSPRFQNRPGGYTTTMKVPLRKGDGAEQTKVSFVIE